MISLSTDDTGIVLPPPGDILRARRPSFWDLPDDVFKGRVVYYNLLQMYVTKKQVKMDYNLDIEWPPDETVYFNLSLLLNRPRSPCK